MKIRNFAITTITAYFRVDKMYVINNHYDKQI